MFVPLDKIQLYDDMHILQPDGSFIVDEKKDGKSTAEHQESIEYFKKVLQRGKKLMPILVKDNEDGSFLRLDGFKRCIAYKELGYKNVEAFVCDLAEHANGIKIPFLDSEIICWKGGELKENIPLFEGKQTDEDFDYDKITFLFKSKNPNGLRIEVDENIHVHWGKFGKNRLALGRKDFIQLAEAISKI